MKLNPEIEVRKLENAETEQEKKIKAGEQKQAYTTLLEKPPALWAWPVKITRQHKHTHNSSVKFFEAGGRTARMVGSLFSFFI